MTFDELGIDYNEEQEKMFAELTRAGDDERLQEWIGNINRTYEARMVNHVLSFFGLDKGVAKSIKARCEEVTGKSELTFYWFHEVVRGFPIKFGTKRLPAKAVADMTDENVDRRFTTTWHYKAYVDLQAESGLEESDWLGLIFPWPGRGDCVMHNCHHLETHGGRRSWRSLKPDRTYYFDLLANKSQGKGVLPWISTIWEPNESNIIRF